MHGQNEVHLTLAMNGHIMSPDCWCEPVNLQQHTNAQGVKMLIVEHNDDTFDHHITVIDARTKNPDWITNLLEEVKV